MGFYPGCPGSGFKCFTNSDCTTMPTMDNSSQHEVGDTDYREDAATGLSIPTCSNSGATEAMFQTNPSLDIASQPNEAPDTEHESHGMYYLPLAVSSVGTEPLGNSLAPSPLHVIQSPLPAHESHSRYCLPPAASSESRYQSLPHVIQSPLPAHESHGGYYLPRSTSSGGAETLRNSLAQLPPHVIQSPLLDSLPTQRRCRPYHGWISNDEEVDLVQLTPAPLPERE
uniref:Uncharacterized protein n=1 Tax=Quercus lobata TaxID=97700 RepID=A0A7N2RET5_QUELO